MACIKIVTAWQKEYTNKFLSFLQHFVIITFLILRSLTCFISNSIVHFSKKIQFKPCPKYEKFSPSSSWTFSVHSFHVCGFIWQYCPFCKNNSFFGDLQNLFSFIFLIRLGCHVIKRPGVARPVLQTPL